MYVRLFSEAVIDCQAGKPDLCPAESAAPATRGDRLLLHGLAARFDRAARCRGARRILRRRRGRQRTDGAGGPGAPCARRIEPAQRAADWLAEQQAVGWIGRRHGDSPDALLADESGHPALADDRRRTNRHGQPIARAVEWALDDQGETHDAAPYVGHDTTLVGWSWAANTHSWLEPTAMFVLALKAVGQSQHARTREAVRLLVDRLLPARRLQLWQHDRARPGTAAARAAHRNRDDGAGRRRQPPTRGSSCRCNTWSANSPPTPRRPRSATACWALAAHHRNPNRSTAWLQTAYQRTTRQGREPVQTRTDCPRRSTPVIPLTIKEVSRKGAKAQRLEFQPDPLRLCVFA